MIRMLNLQKGLARPANAEAETGSAMVEYGLLIALVAVVAIIGLRVLGVDIGHLFNSIASALGG
jgi:Flp pilus assembly pilin Flp